MTANDLSRSIDVVKAPWADSPYYERAEATVELFWGERTVFRRYYEQLDLDAVIELACGHGRHAIRSATRCRQLTLVDVFEANLKACRARLSAFDNVDFVLGAGADFQPLPDASFTAIYCYDAMVHFSPDLVGAYLQDAARVLKPGGRMLSHLSNFPAPLDRHYGQNPCARNHMTPALLDQLTQRAGLRMLDATEIAWGGHPALDRVVLWERPAG